MDFSDLAMPPDFGAFSFHRTDALNRLSLKDHSFVPPFLFKGKKVIECAAQMFALDTDTDRKTDSSKMMNMLVIQVIVKTPE
jgi:hypothetical protein